MGQIKLWQEIRECHYMHYNNDITVKPVLACSLFPQWYVFDAVLAGLIYFNDLCRSCFW